MVIEALDRVIPVFTERLELGVNTGYCRSLARSLASQAQAIALATQNARRKQIIPATPKLSILKDAAIRASEKINSLEHQEMETENANANGRRYLVGVAKGHVGELLNGIADLESHCGSFHIWVKQPARATCRSLLLAWQKGESDSGEYFVWFRDCMLGLPASRLDPYLAQVVAGVRVVGGELRLLEGDLHQGRKNPDLAEMSDDEICKAITRKARRLKLADEKGKTDRIPVYAPGETKGAARRFDALEHAVLMEEPALLEEIGKLFAVANPLETKTVMHAAIIEARTRDDFERVFRKVELSRELARFTARVAAGRACWEADPAAARVIGGKRLAIVEALKGDRVFGCLFDAAGSRRSTSSRVSLRTRSQRLRSRRRSSTKSPRRWRNWRMRTLHRDAQPKRADL
jgi:hypothetical protein